LCERRSARGGHQCFRVRALEVQPLAARRNRRGRITSSAALQGQRHAFEAAGGKLGRH
jgi:hypothetical protein